MTDIIISGRGHKNLAKKVYHWQGNQDALDAYARYSGYADCIRAGAITFNNVNAIREFIAEIEDGEIPIASCDQCGYMEVGFDYCEIIHFDAMEYRFKDHLCHLCQKCLDDMPAWDFVRQYLLP